METGVNDQGERVKLDSIQTMLGDILQDPDIRYLPRLSSYAQSTIENAMCAPRYCVFSSLCLFSFSLCLSCFVSFVCMCVLLCFPFFAKIFFEFVGVCVCRCR